MHPTAISQIATGRAFGTPEALQTSSRVLLLVDFINPLGFDGASGLAPRALAAAQATATLKRRLAQAGVRAIYVNDNFGHWGSDIHGLVAQCREKGGDAAQLVQHLWPAAEDLTVLKPRHSGFHATPLHLLLLELGARELVLTGLVTDYCVVCTAMDAYVQGFNLWVPSDCSAGLTAESHERALSWMRLALKVDTTPSFASLEASHEKPVVQACR